MAVYALWNNKGGVGPSRFTRHAVSLFTRRRFKSEVQQGSIDGMAE